MRISLLVAVLCLVICGCGPPPSMTPRGTGVDSRAYVGEAELYIRYRYVPLPRFEMQLWVDLMASEGTVGEVAVEVKPRDFDVTRGPLQWTANLGSGDEDSQSVRLRSSGTSKAPAVTIVTKRVEGNVELASDTVRFIVDEDQIRECRPTDPACEKP